MKSQEQKRLEAEARQKLYDSLSIKEKIKLVKKRNRTYRISGGDIPGESKRELERLNASLRNSG